MLTWSQASAIVEALTHHPHWRVMEVQQRQDGYWVVCLFKHTRPMRKVEITSWDGYREYWAKMESERHEPRT